MRISDRSSDVCSSDLDSLVSKPAVTAADGSVRLTGLDPATNYTVVVDASGYGDFSANNVAVVSGKNLSLGYALGAMTLDTVVVTGTSLAAVDTTSEDRKSVVSGKSGSVSVELGGCRSIKKKERIKIKH